jgi:uncharacterized membrane protein
MSTTLAKGIGIAGFAVFFLAFFLFLPDVTWQSGVIVILALLPLFVYAIFLSNGQRDLRITILLTALVGLAYASYLAYNWYSGSVTQCASDGCSIAEASPYATLFFSLPTATVGVIGYLLILLSLLYDRPLGHLITSLLAAFAFATSLFLTFVSVFILKTTCQWCLGSAAAMTSIALLAYLLTTRDLEKFFLQKKQSLDKSSCFL